MGSASSSICFSVDDQSMNKTGGGSFKPIHYTEAFIWQFLGKYTKQSAPEKVQIKVKLNYTSFHSSVPVNDTTLSVHSGRAFTDRLPVCSFQLVATPEKGQTWTAAQPLHWDDVSSSECANQPKLASKTHRSGEFTEIRFCHRLLATSLMTGGYTLCVQSCSLGGGRYKVTMSEHLG